MSALSAPMASVDVEQAEPRFLDRPRTETARRYHDRHPFHLRMHEGRASVQELRRASLLEAVAASLTETLAPGLMERRIAAFERHYPTIPGEALAYFRTRVGAARVDGDRSLAYVLEHACTRAEQDACVRAVVTKTDVLWHLLDCVATECETKRGLV